jgi:hypothetical protein
MSTYIVVKKPGEHENAAPYFMLSPTFDYSWDDAHEVGDDIKSPEAFANALDKAVKVSFAFDDGDIIVSKWGEWRVIVYPTLVSIDKI